MSTTRIGWTTAFLVGLAATSAWAQAQRHTQLFPNSDKGFDAFARRIEQGRLRNLLGRKIAKIDVKAVKNAEYIADGDAGYRAADGRVNVDGKPSVVTVYLGKATPIYEVGVFTFNGDSRANQDFEVRFADNSARPGKKPAFGKTADLTTGDKILGGDRGGAHTRFAAEDGKWICPKADWVEFRIWRTYPSHAGEKARTNKPSGWTSLIELEVYGAPEDVAKPDPAELAREKALRDARRAARALPAKPEYAKQADWQATFRAAWQAVLAWETQRDRVMLPAWGAAGGEWHVIGPVPAGSPLAKQIESDRRLAPDKPVKVAGKGKGKQAAEVAWKPLPALHDGELADVAKLVGGAKPGERIYLARTLNVLRAVGRREPLSAGVGLGAGWIRTLPNNRGVRASDPQRPACPNQVTWSLSTSIGRHVILAGIPVDKAGKAEFYFMPHVGDRRFGAGDDRTRAARREKLFDEIAKDHDDPVSRMQMRWEDEDQIWVRVVKGRMARRDKVITDWRAGDPDFLGDRYRAATAKRLAMIEKELPSAPPAARAKVGQWLAGQLADIKSEAELPKTAELRAQYYAAASLLEAIREARRLEGFRLAVEDQKQTWGKDYPKGQEYLARVKALERKLDAAWSGMLTGKADALAAVLAVRTAADADSRTILLANPLLRDMGTLLLVRGGPRFASNWGGANNLGKEIVTLSPVRPDGEIKVIHTASRISDMDLHFDGQRILYSDGRYMHEVRTDGTGHRQISHQTDDHVYHYDGCYLPNDRIVFVSTACEQAVPCTGGWHVGNLHVMDADGRNERRLTYDQDHNWNPCVLNNGRVLYTRWEYTDTPHYFSRLLFHMNPDGTRQMEYYGSNSYWPNALYWARPIPGEATKIVAVVSGHHGVARVGEMVLFDPARGRHEADGVIQRIGDRGKKVEPVIIDGLVKDVWPRFATPQALAEAKTNRGAGKYFLASIKMTERSPWGLYLVDVFDNMTLLLAGGYSQPFALRPRPRPPIVTPQVNLARKDGLVYMTDVYRGPGLAGYPRGTIKQLRIGSHHFRYGGNGDTRASSYEGGWDVKIIHGTVPVHEDGSAYFRVPANTPIFVQPLDADGKAQQTMRSWFVAMPGEVLSCVGCHEKQNSTTPNARTLASMQPPSDIQPWFGPTRGFSFDREVQPVLDRRCAGCHTGKQHKLPDGRTVTLPDFRAKRLHKDYTGNYSPAYLALQKYVRRAGYEADYHMAKPAEWAASTSPLVQTLLKGHHNVQLTPAEWRRLYAWIDFNVPYPANWSESHRPPESDQVARRAKYMQLYADVRDDVEKARPLPPVATFEPPKPQQPPAKPLTLAGWPWKADEAKQRQKGAGLKPITLDLAPDQRIELVPIPAGKFVMGDASGFPDERPQSVVEIGQPFYLATCEITNAQYALFDPLHKSGYIDARGKDRFTRGYPANEPGQPVIRVSWHEAMAFCRWLSRKTGRHVTLPTEAQWEYACRAGTAGPWNFALDPKTGQLPARVANLADRSISSWAFGRVEGDYNDGARYSVAPGQYPPNAFGLCDMHGNVAEWTRTTYKPYPYTPTDGRDAGKRDRHLRSASEPVPLYVVRGGSWFDTARFARSAHRWRYPPHQPVFNVGFRIAILPDAEKVAKK